MPSAIQPRIKLLRMLHSPSRGSRRGHRYDALRTLSMTVSLGILVAVPLSGLARVDFWAGAHRLLFEPVALKPGLAGVIIGIGMMYVVTFLSNVVAGRMFCGWGCPVGQMSRLGEAVEVPGLSLRERLIGHAKGAAFSAVFVLAMLAWWVDLRVLWLGSPRALAWSWGVLAVGSLLVFLHARFWRWEFCKTTCPIGLYYSFVSPAKWFGIHFRNEQHTCIECDACDKICPVDLTPRDLTVPASPRGGLAIMDAPGRNHCLECGDCVRACETMVALKGKSPAPLELGYYSGSQNAISMQGSSNPQMHTDAQG